MWNDIVTQLSKYPNAVLTGIDPDGYPFSMRCKPQVDESRKVLLIEQSGDVRIQPGPAGILCHYHDEQMWDLRSFQIHGTLEQAGQIWVFRPERYIPWGSTSGQMDQMRSLFKTRAVANKYLQKRGLPRPKVDWDEIKKLRAEAKDAS
jgi:hypothetical protein